ncbi:hypothetical protein AB6A40_002086 [Gnathostoma spinigerum]|uniref:Uncharacterized protein n=1 Tax=Gnathostoma spinigerum TaxID=75299 RepID=A0ABD6EFD1_9BILA
MNVANGCLSRSSSRDFRSDFSTYPLLLVEGRVSHQTRPHSASLQAEEPAPWFGAIPNTVEAEYAKRLCRF